LRHWSSGVIVSRLQWSSSPLLHCSTGAMVQWGNVNHKSNNNNNKRPPMANGRMRAHTVSGALLTHRTRARAHSRALARASSEQPRATLKQRQTNGKAASPKDAFICAAGQLGRELLARVARMARAPLRHVSITPDLSLATSSPRPTTGPSLSLSLSLYLSALPRGPLAVAPQTDTELEWAPQSGRLLIIFAPQLIAPHQAPQTTRTRPRTLPARLGHSH